jgi:hypothetical protein
VGETFSGWRSESRRYFAIFKMSKKRLRPRASLKRLENSRVLRQENFFAMRKGSLNSKVVRP